MYLLGIHVGNTLRLIARALELPRGIHNVPNCVVSPVFAERLLDAVHDDRRHGLHALYSFTSRLALNEARQNIDVVHTNLFMPRDEQS